jgi:hypothetical protein
MRWCLTTVAPPSVAAQGGCAGAQPDAVRAGLIVMTADMTVALPWRRPRGLRPLR